MEEQKGSPESGRAMIMAWIAMIVAVISLLASGVFFFTSIQIHKAEMPEMGAIMRRIEALEKRVSEVREAGEGDERVAIVLRRALLALEEARALTGDKDLAERVLELEEGVRGLITPQVEPLDGEQVQ